MGYESIQMVATYVQWLIGAAIAIIMVRCLYMIQSMSSSVDENVSAASIWKKVSNHVKALVIFVIVEAIVSLLKGYFFHV